MTIIKIGVEIMDLQKIIFEVCPKCQSIYIHRTENENSAWRCSDCHTTFEVPLIAKLPDLEK
jgi:transposase-like protein